MGLRRRHCVYGLLFTSLLLALAPLMLIQYAYTVEDIQPHPWTGKKANFFNHAHNRRTPPSPSVLPNAAKECNVRPPRFSSPDWLLTRHTPPVSASCGLLFKGDEGEAKRVRKVMESWKSSISDMEFLQSLASNCTRTRLSFSSNFYTSRVEKKIPLAYSFLIHHKEGLLQQLVRLLKVLYRPHNVYCVHVDNSAPTWWKTMVKNFTSCFPNVIASPQSVYVVYGTVRILYAHLSCFRELVKSTTPWQYVINLHSTEIPLATNRELVELVENMDGVNIVHEGENTSDPYISHDTRRKIEQSITWDPNGNLILKTRTSLKTPFNLTLFKSAASANSALTREYVEFILTDKHAQYLIRYLRNFLSAIEFFFSTLNHLPDAPGSMHLLKKRKMPLLVKRIWYHEIVDDQALCKEQYLVHKICICSASDLPWIKQAMEKRQFYFLNKYWIGYDHVVMDCIEEMLVQRNVEEYVRDCR